MPYWLKFRWLKVTKYCLTDEKFHQRKLLLWKFEPTRYIYQKIKIEKRNTK